MKLRLRKQHKAQGFTLIELLLALGIMSIAFAGIISYLSHSAEITRAEGAGEQLADVGKALDRYINRESGVLQSCLTANQVIQVPATILTQSAGTTTVGSCTLNNRQILPGSFSNMNLFGMGYNIYIKSNASNNLGGLVLTASPVTDPASSTATVRYDWIGAAMKKAGAQSGMTFLNTGANSLRGLGGGWAFTNVDFPAINQLGLLGYRVGYQASYDDVYLRLDGAYPMRGSLNMGNYNINNATDINFNGWLNGNNALLNNLKTGYISNTGNIQTDTSTTTTMAAVGGVETNPTPTDQSGASFKGLHSWDIFAENDLGVGGDGTYSAVMRRNGTIEANDVYLHTVGCADNGSAVLPSGTSAASMRTNNCINGGYSGWLSERLPQYVSRGVVLVQNQSVIAKPVCSAGGTPRIILVPQIQNIYGYYPVQLTMQLNPDNSLTYQFIRPQPMVSTEQMQVYATDNGSSWTAQIKSLTAAQQGVPDGVIGKALAHLFCDYGR